MVIGDKNDLADLPDEELLTLAAAGGTHRDRAWSVLVRRLSPRMFAVARSFRLDTAVCDDLVQTAWLRLIDRAGQLRDPGSVRPWLCMVVRNEARNLVTRTRTVPTADGFDLRADDRGREPDADLLRDERAIALRSAFARLGEDCRRLLILSTTEPPLSYDEIAAAMDRPRGSLGPTRRRCLDRLRGFLPPGIEP